MFLHPLCVRVSVAQGVQGCNVRWLCLPDRLEYTLRNVLSCWSVPITTVNYRVCVYIHGPLAMSETLTPLLPPSTGSKQTSLSQGTSPLTPVPPSSLGEKGKGGTTTTGGEGDGGKKNSDLTLTLPHSDAQSMKKKLIVVQKYEPKPRDKGLPVNRGETVLLVRDDGAWLYVKNESGVEGYVPRSHLLSPSRTRARTTSRSGMALTKVASNGSVPMHSTQSVTDHSPHDGSTVNPRITSTSPLSQEEFSHHSQPHTHHHSMSNGHNHHHHPPPPPPPRLTAPNEILYDHHKHSPTSSSGGVASLVDPFSPGSSNSPMVPDHTDRGGRDRTVQSSSSSLNDSCGSSCEQEHHVGRPTLVSPLNHIEGGRDALRRTGGGGGGTAENIEDIPRSNSTSSRSTGDSLSAPRPTPVANGIHYIDKTTNHIYSTLEQPISPPPPPLPPRNMSGGFSASQDPSQNVYAQLEREMPPPPPPPPPAVVVGGVYKTCSQEALVHPSHRHNSYSEGWTRDRKPSGQPLRSASAVSIVNTLYVCVRE